VIGTGYVGLATAACLADLGHRVTGIDIDATKVAILQAGKPPIYERGLEELMAGTMKTGRLRFTTDYSAAIPDADFVFLAVGTPIGPGGEADLTFIKQAARSVGQAVRRPLVVVIKSTVPVGTGDLVAAIIRQNLVSEVPVPVVSNPEFLREGSAIADFRRPDRIVIGSHDRDASDATAALYAALEARVVITDLYTAEMIKYASNAYLATRISFINEIARICERVNADVKGVTEGMGLDRRIGPLFLEAGLGFGGSCFPKDVRALLGVANRMGYRPELLDAVMRINDDQRRLLVDKVRDVLGGLQDQVVGLLGLSYKPNTDDVRDAPSLDLIQNLLQNGAQVRAYDPKAMPALQRQVTAIQYCPDPYAAAAGADALVVVTEWDEFRTLDLGRIKRLMRRPVVIDGRNIYEPKAMRQLGFTYRGMGRPAADGRPAPKVRTARKAPTQPADLYPAVSLAPAG
jgi:UDPglucose 6-dehydrogenase